MTIRSRSEYLGNCYLAKTISNSGCNSYKNVKCFLNICKKHKKEINSVFGECLANMGNWAHKIDSKAHYNLYNYDYNTMITSIPINTNLGNNIKLSNTLNVIVDDFLSENNACAIYTDGSKSLNSKHCRSAVISQYDDFYSCKALVNEASVFTAECVALNEAIIHAIDSIDNKNIIIFSDPLSALRRLESTKLDVKTSDYIINSKKHYNSFLHRNDSNSSISFYWLPSHSGVRGNEQAVKLAKEATHFILSVLTLFRLPICMNTSN